MKQKDSNKRIAIIGAGWAGLQTASSLIKFGFDAKNIVIFDEREKIGGTFSPDCSYTDLKLHTPRLAAECLNYMFPGDKDTRATAIEVYRYLESYVDFVGIRDIIKLNQKVISLEYNSRSKKAILILEVKSYNKEGGKIIKKKQEGPFDMIVYSSIIGPANYPRFVYAEKENEQRKFEGVIIHSSQVRSDLVDAVLRENKKVTIVGGGKSGVDMCTIFCNRGYQTNKNINWLYRSPYWFAKYEVFFHHRSFIAQLRAFLLLLTFPFFCVSSDFALFLWWLTGCVIRMPGSSLKYFDSKRFRFAFLDENERRAVSMNPPIVGDPVGFTSGGLKLKDGRVVLSDVIIFATSYKVGFSSIKILKDDCEVDPQIFNKVLYDHAILPEIPCVFIGHTFLTCNGPLRGVNIADYILHYLERQSSLTEVDMRTKANKLQAKHWTLGNNALFTSEFCYPKELMTVSLDFWLLGYISLMDLFRYYFNLFVMGIHKLPPRFSFSKACACN